MTQKTRITGLADGAHNCWSVILALKPHCKSLELVLDWFHIGKKFQNVSNGLGETFTESLDSAKWSLWHGKVDDALRKIALLRDNLTKEANQAEKLTRLLEE